MPILRRGPAGPGHQALNLEEHPKGIYLFPVTVGSSPTLAGDKWIGPFVASALAPARQGVVFASIVASMLAPARQGVASAARWPQRWQWARALPRGGGDAEAAGGGSGPEAAEWPWARHGSRAQGW